MVVKLFKPVIFLAILLTILTSITFINISKVNSLSERTLSNHKTQEDNLLHFSDLINLGNILNYGNWCGATNTKPIYVMPIDAVDAACKVHDLCIGNNDHKCSCDADFLANIAEAKAISPRGENYKIAAIEVISKKPCYCLDRFAGRKVKLLGFGGRC